VVYDVYISKFIHDYLWSFVNEMAVGMISAAEEGEPRHMRIRTRHAGTASASASVGVGVRHGKIFFYVCGKCLYNFNVQYVSE
jgi:hypothetical protein